MLKFAFVLLAGLPMFAQEFSPSAVATELKTTYWLYSNQYPFNVPSMGIVRPPTVQWGVAVSADAIPANGEIVMVTILYQDATGTPKTITRPAVPDPNIHKSVIWIITGSSQPKVLGVVAHSLPAPTV